MDNGWFYILRKANRLFETRKDNTSHFIKNFFFNVRENLGLESTEHHLDKARQTKKALPGGFGYVVFLLFIFWCHTFLVQKRYLNEFLIVL